MPDRIFDVLYAPMGHGWAVHLVDYPEARIDIATELDVAGFAIWALAPRVGVERHEIAVRVRKVDAIPGRDAPLRVESPSQTQAMQLLDEQLENDNA
jgi:hypothetical protein